MAFYETNTCASVADFLDKFAIFAAVNGWTVDVNTISGGNRRLHLHKDAYHFELQQVDVQTVRCSCCTGYASGSSWDAQPGASGIFVFFNSAVTGPYTFVSSHGALWMYRSDVGYGNQSWAGLGWIVDKAGAWTGGQFAIGANTSSQDFFTFSAKDDRAFRFDGAWYVNASEGGLVGNVVPGGSSLTGRQPCTYHAGIVPIPVKAFRKNMTNTALLHPLGLVPGVYHCRCGDVYVPGEIITISGSDYLLMPGDRSTYAAGSPEFAFKLGT